MGIAKPRRKENLYYLARDKETDLRKSLGHKVNITSSDFNKAVRAEVLQITETPAKSSIANAIIEKANLTRDQQHVAARVRCEASPLTKTPASKPRCADLDACAYESDWLHDLRRVRQNRHHASKTTQPQNLP